MLLGQTLTTLVSTSYLHESSSDSVTEQISISVIWLFFWYPWQQIEDVIKNPTSVTMKCYLLLSLFASVGAFSPALKKADVNTALHAEIDRRTLLGSAAAASILSLNSFSINPALAVDTKKVVVAGATGQTGRRILERLAGTAGLSVVGGVRNVDKAQASLAESSTVIRGAMVQKVASVDTSAVELKHLDVVKDSVDEIAATLAGADSLVIATGFIPGNPLKMNAAAHGKSRTDGFV